MVIVRKQNLWSVLDRIKQQTGRILVLKTNDIQYQDFFFVMYDTASHIKPELFSQTIVHRKGKCFYTINALNNLIQKQNGVVDKQYVIDWDRHQNTILFMNKEKQFKEIPTKLYKIIN